ncbi:MAG TPA: polysaccharide lyase family protein [Tepidisphaeraceae bacterium]|nr:polysaccharide lyase family protein [Tepidisphaeraceae bacterium]
MPENYRPLLSRRGKLVAIGLAAALARPALAVVTVAQNSSTNWTITNGAMTVVFNPSKQDLTSVKLGVGGSASSNLLVSGGTVDQEFAGTPFGGGAQTFNLAMGPNNSYADVWTDSASAGAAMNATGTLINPVDYQFHYLMFDNDSTIHVYEVVNHSATDPATSVGQGQFLFRSNPTLFPNFYQQNTGPNNMVGVTTTNVPSTASNFSSVSGQAGRTVQDATTDLTASGIAGDNGTNFYTKYDYSSYTQFWQATTAYGPQFSVSSVVPSTETMTGGPTKQVLNQTNPGIINLEFLSDHYGIDGAGPGNAFPGYAYFPTQGVASSRLFGPYAFNIESSVGKTGAQINQDAVNSIAKDQALYQTDTTLIGDGYLTTGNRGSVQINAASPAGWSSNSTKNTVVLSDNGVNMQESHQGYQYWAQLSSNGSANITNAAPGTYRLTMYQIGQWGETRVDGVQVQQGKVNTPQNLKFTPENFGTAAPIWTIGSPDRSAGEFLNGHNAQGLDQRQFYGAYDYWGEMQTLGTPGKVVYYATGVGATPATNDPNKWIANEWKTFNPGLYDSANTTDDNYANIAPAYVRDAAHGGTGSGPGSFTGSPWEVHFTVTPTQLAQGQFVVLSVGAVALKASLVVLLNGHSETWSFNNFSGPDDPMTRSGDAGFYQWAAFQFPVADLNAAGADDMFTFGVSQTDGVMFDALRMEITNTSASPTTTGWDDYNYITSSKVGQNDAVALAALNSFSPLPEPSCISLLAGGLLLLSRRKSR